MRLLIKTFKVLLPVFVIGLSIWVAQQVIANKPQPQRRTPEKPVTTIEAMRLEPRDYKVRIASQGTVRPRTESTLIAEISGRVVAVADNFRSGGFFEPGDVLLQIDPRDYEIAITVAEAQLAKARVAVAEEQARAEVAEREWQQLQRKPASSRLALRQPYLAAARAELAAAEAQLAKARLNLERTRITAPYAGRVLEQRADIGQFVATGTVLARIYAVDYAEIRLPLAPHQLDFIDLPENYRGEPAAAVGPEVMVTARGGRSDYHWQGRIVRAEGAIDTQSRQLFVIAQIIDPYGKYAERQAPLRVGQFVEASIEGRWLNNVFVLPRNVIRHGNELIIVDADNQLQRRQVNVVWSDQDNIIVDAGIAAGELISLTPLGAIEGVEVVTTIVADTAAATPAAERQLAQRHTTHD